MNSLPLRRDVRALLTFTALLILGASRIALAPDAASANQMIPVNTVADTMAGSCIGVDENCSLRKAISLVNSGEVQGEVTIRVEASGTIKIGSLGELAIDPPGAVSSLAIEIGSAHVCT